MILYILICDSEILLAGIKSEHCDVQTTKPNEDGTNKTNMEENESQVKMQELFLHEPSTNPGRQYNKINIR